MLSAHWDPTHQAEPLWLAFVFVFLAAATSQTHMRRGSHSTCHWSYTPLNGSTMLKLPAGTTGAVGTAGVVGALGAGAATRAACVVSVVGAGTAAWCRSLGA